MKVNPMKYLKTKELIYSLMKSAVSVRNNELKNKINHWSLQLFEYLTLENFEESLKATKILTELISFGKMIYEVEPVNSEILFRELENLESAIRQCYGFAGLPNVKDVFFSDNLSDTSMSGEVSENESDASGGLNTVIRQSSILEKIRYFANNGCQMKDLMSAFPEVSERTIRYDLQRLLGQGLIARNGNGSSTSYIVST